MEANSLVPKLRFKEFNGAWEGKRTLFIAPLKRGFDLTSSDVVDGEYPVVYSNGVLKHHNDFKAKGPGVITGRSGTIGSVHYVENNFWPHNTSLWVTNFFDNFPKFIYYFYVRFKLNRYNAGSTVPTLNRNDVHFVKKFIPGFIEQKKIASFLTSVDKKINLLTKKKALLESYKKGVMQKIFSQEIRFKDEDGKDFPEWKNSTLGEECEINGGGTPDSTNENYWGNEIYWFTPTEIKVKYLKRSKRMITRDGLNNSSAKLLPKGSLLLTTRATIGDVAFCTNECSTNQGFQSFLPTSKPNLDFLYQWIKCNKKELIKKSSGSTFLEISKKEIQKITIKLPIINEQNKIASFLSSIDKKIELVDFQLERNKEFKKGLLQQMFV